MKSKRLFDFFHRFTDNETCQKVLGLVKEQKQTSSIACPHCESSAIVRYGIYRDRQRYKCKDCSRTFNDFTNTPLHGTHFPHKWIKFLECLMDGCTLQHSAMKVGVSYVTLFYWRHKIIHVLEKMDNAQRFDDVREMYPEKIKYIWVLFYPPIDALGFYEGRAFKPWISSFICIAKKYLYRYVAWFRFVERANERKKKILDSMSDLLLKVCSQPMYQTYNNLRIG